jgi:hypothetical protein
MNHLQQFTDALFDPNDTIEIRCFRDDRHGAGPQAWLTAAELPTDPRPARFRDGGWGVFVGANPRAQRGEASTNGVALARCLWIDCDPKEGFECIEHVDERIADAGLPEPTIIIGSGNGWHCYWRLTEPMTDLKAWQARMKALIESAGSDGSVHDPPRVMRLPGSSNRKPKLIDELGDDGAEVHIVRCSGERYPLDRFPQPMAQLPVVRHELTGDDGRPGDDFNRRGDVRDLLERHGWTRVSEGENERSIGRAHV